MINNNSNVVFDNIDLKPVAEKKITYFSKVLDNSSFFTYNQVAVYNLLELQDIETNYNNFFYIFETIEPLELHSLTDNHEKVNDITCINKENNYLLVHYENKNCLPLIDYLNASKTQVIYYKRLMDSYKQMLNCVKLLNNIGIIHNNIQDKSNILVDLSKEHVLLSRFSLSIILKNVINISSNISKEEYLKQFYRVYEPTYYYWPIEIHLLTYLLYKLDKCETLSKHNINTVIENVYNSNNNKLGIGLDDAKKEAKEFFEQFVNMKREDVIAKICSFGNSWDLYSMSCVFYEILISKYKQNLFIQLFNKLLLVCLRPNPEKRFDVSLCITNFNKIVSNLNINVFYSLVV